MNFKPTIEQISLAEALMVAMAFEDLIRPTVEAYETAILAKHQFRLAPKWREYEVTPEIILDRKRIYLLSKEDAAIYHQECFDARDKAGLKVSHPENCPLLEAEGIRIKCENALLKEMATIPGLENFDKGILPLDLRKQAIDITLKLLAPFCGSSEAILYRIKNEKAA